MSMFTWEKVDPPPGVAVAPMQRLSWGKTAGLGAQHVVAMFGATFVFPLVMGLDPNLAIMFSGICTIMFLLIVNNGCRATSAPARPSWPASRPSAARAVTRPTSPARSWWPASCWLRWACLIHFAGSRLDPQDPAARGHRRRRDADRLQSCAGGRDHLLARGPVGRAGHRHVHGGRRRDVPRLLVADRGVLGADLRLPPVLVLRPPLRHDQLGARRPDRRRRTTTGSGTGSRSRTRTGSASPAGLSATAWTSSTARASR